MSSSFSMLSPAAGIVFVPSLVGPQALGIIADPFGHISIESDATTAPRGSVRDYGYPVRISGASGRNRASLRYFSPVSGYGASITFARGGPV
jgi:hypothetical protein